MAAADLLGCVISFKEKTGVDLEHLLPGRAEQVDLLRRAEPHDSIDQATGKKFTNRFVILDFTASHQVCFLLSAGTGAKLDDERLEQPFVRRLAALARKQNPRLIFGKRIGRLTRSGWGFGPVALVLEVKGGFLGDGIHGILAVKGPNSVLIFFAAQQAQTDAENIKPQTRGGMRDRTDTHMVDGRAKFAVGHTAPAGFTIVRLRDGAGIGRCLLVLDTPGVLPEPDEVAYGLPEVFDGAGRRVDQVANVRWALGKLGRPEWPLPRISKELKRRQFSTATLRKHNHDPARTYASPGQHPYHTLMMRTIINKIPMYKTGEFRSELGIAGFDPVVVRDCFPLDGKWATTKDFERIEEWLVARPDIPQCVAKYTFVGFRICVNGVDATLVKDKVTKRGVGYFALMPGNSKLGKVRVPGGVRIPHAELADMLIDAITSAGHPGGLLSADPDDEDTDSAVSDALEAINAELAALAVESGTIWARVAGTDGEPKPTGTLFLKLNDRFNEIEETERPELEAKAAALTAIDPVVGTGADFSTTESDQLLALVASLARSDVDGVPLGPLSRHAGPDGRHHRFRGPR